MAVSHIEEKILGRLAKQTASSNALLSASLYQALGLSILLSKRLYRARKQRKLDTTRDTKSLQLYHHIIWLAREGLSITEVYILPYCQDGEQGPECRVMAAKLRASFYHVFCLFHNHPPISQVSGRSNDSASSPSSARTPKGNNGQKRASDSKSPKIAKDGGESRRRAGKTALRDPIPSMTSDTSYVTNPYATGTSHTPPVPGLPGVPPGDRKTPTHPPGLTQIPLSPSQAAASFLLPPLNFVPMAKEHFESTQRLSNTVLSPSNALRLSVSLEHAAFLWDCVKDYERAQRLARRTIREVYASPEGLDDDEFADASALVQALAAIVKRGSNESTPQQGFSTSPTNGHEWTRKSSSPPIIDRTIPISPPRTYASPRNVKTEPPPTPPSRPITRTPPSRPSTRTPERLSTVPEVDSVDEKQSQRVLPSPSISRPSSGGNRGKRTPSTTSDKASRRRAVEQAEERHHRQRQSPTATPNDSGGSRSRHSSPPDGYVRKKNS